MAAFSKPLCNFNGYCTKCLDTGHMKRYGHRGLDACKTPDFALLDANWVMDENGYWCVQCIFIKKGEICKYGANCRFSHSRTSAFSTPVDDTHAEEAENLAGVIEMAGAEAEAETEDEVDVSVDNIAVNAKYVAEQFVQLMNIGSGMYDLDRERYLQILFDELASLLPGYTPADIAVLGGYL